MEDKDLTIDELQKRINKLTSKKYKYPIVK